MDVTSYLLGKKSGGGGVTPTGTIQIATNGTHDVTNYASANVNVPNTYIASDEGKVVSSGALVSQTSQTVTSNNTYDTTLINSLTVNVSGGGGGSDLNWSTLGYSGRPSEIDTGYDYAAEIKQYWVPEEMTDLSTYYRYDFNLVFFPSVDTSYATNMRYMFDNCPSLIKIGSMDMSNVTNTENMFGYCRSLKAFDSTGFNATKITNMASMFSNCKSLVNLNMSGISTNEVTNMSNMFMECDAINELDLSNWQTPKLKNCSYMFYNCLSLVQIDARNMTFSGLSSWSEMFGSFASAGVPDDCLIIVKDATEKAWLESKFSRLANIQTVAEYEA